MYVEFSSSPATCTCPFVLHELLVANVRQCSQGRHILYLIITKLMIKISVAKFLPMIAGGEIGEHYLLAKISIDTVHTDTRLMSSGSIVLTKESKSSPGMLGWSCLCS